MQQHSTFAKKRRLWKGVLCLKRILDSEKGILKTRVESNQTNLHHHITSAAAEALLTIQTLPFSFCARSRNDGANVCTKLTDFYFPSLMLCLVLMENNR